VVGNEAFNQLKPTLQNKRNRLAILVADNLKRPWLRQVYFGIGRINTSKEACSDRLTTIIL